jgi:MAPEG family
MCPTCCHCALGQLFTFALALAVHTCRSPPPANCCRYDVEHPALYATPETCKGSTADAKKFNCVQRGHQNCLENQPIVLAMMVAGGLKVRATA